MRRRDLSKALFAAGGMAAVAQNARAQGCGIPCYAPTQAEISAGAAVVDESYLPGDVRRYGAAGNGTANDTTAIQNALNASTRGGYTVYLPAGTYRVISQLQKFQAFECPNIRGDGYQYSRIVYDAALGARAALYIQGGSGRPCGAVIERIGFEGRDGQSGSYGIEVDGQDGLTIRDCAFGANAVGLRLHNMSSGAFTEYVVAENCSFAATCRRALEYVVSGQGSESFNGSGLRNCLVVLDSGNDRSIYVGPGAFAYHAPMSMQIWTYGTGKTVIWNDSTRIPLFHGTITIEPFGPFGTRADCPKLAGGRQVQLLGNIATAAYVNYGELLVGTHAARLGPESGGANGQAPIRRHPWTLRKPLTSGTNVVDYVGGDSGQLVYVELSGANYDYRYLLAIAHQGFGGAGLVQTVATLNTFNAAGYGAPTFSVGADGNFRILNPSFPSSGVTAYVDVQPFGLSRSAYMASAVEYGN